MARTIEQITSELNSVYQPQVDQVNTQLAELPKFYEAQNAGLGVAKENAFRDITGAASARGMVYSGMPIAEQSRYVGEKYLPALAQLQQQQSQQKFGLQGQLNDIYGKRMSQAQALQQSELDREEQARQAEAERQYKLQVARMQASSSRRGGSARQPSAADRMMAAQQAFGQALQFAQQNPGKVNDGYREIVQQQVGQQYGLDPKTLGALSGQYFPNGWEWQSGIRK